MAAVRLALILLLVAAFALLGIPLYRLATHFGWRWREQVPMLFHTCLIRLLRIKTLVQGEIAATPALLISNHVSWTDISLIGALAPMCFVAKSDVASWPVFGALARAQGSVFVNRNRRREVHQVNLAMAARLNEGRRVMLFPEGTTGDGNRMLRFLTSHFAAPREALKLNPAPQTLAVQAVSIAYHRQNGMVMDRNMRSSKAWYGDTALLPHLWSLLRGGTVIAVVTFAPPVQIDVAQNRKLLAGAFFRQIQEMNYMALYGRKPVATQTPSSHS